MLQEEIANCPELFYSVLSVHFVQYIVMSSLDWNMNEAINSWVVQKVGNCMKMVEHVRRVCHSNPHHYSVMVLQLFTERN